MSNPEQDLIQELMQLTGRSEKEAEAFLEVLKGKMVGETGMPGQKKTSAREKKPFTAEDYPHYLPADEVHKYTLRFTLKDIRPAIWRKVEVPSNISLRHLSELIIGVMGWSGIHLNQFRKGVDTYYEPYYQRDGDYEDFSNVGIRHFNQEEVSVGEVLAEKGKHIIFEYDFGDSWEHEVQLSSIGEYRADEPRLIRFAGGKRACPPEDCGAIWGYEELCEISAKKKAGKRLTRDERERLEWYSGDDGLFDTESLDLEDCADVVEFLNSDDH